METCTLTLLGIVHYEEQSCKPGDCFISRYGFNDLTPVNARNISIHDDIKLKTVSIKYTLAHYAGYNDYSIMSLRLKI